MPDTHPATLAETVIQTRGRWLLIVGAVIVAATAAISALWRLLHGDDLPLGIALPLSCAGFGAIGVGVTERLHRQTRATHQQAIDCVAAFEAPVQGAGGHHRRPPRVRGGRDRRGADAARGRGWILRQDVSSDRHGNASHASACRVLSMWRVGALTHL